jgi:hypothetical protein
MQQEDDDEDDDDGLVTPGPARPGPPEVSKHASEEPKKETPSEVTKTRHRL